MRNYIGIDGKSYSSIDELSKANREVKNNPIYLKEMRRRAVANIPGDISREDWQKLLKLHGEHQELQASNVKQTVVEPVNYVDKFEKEKPVEKKEEKEVKKEVKPEVVEESTEEKKKYSFNISERHKSLVRSANAKGIPFELNGEQIDSILERRCHFCSTKSETLITVGDKFDYPNARPVCGTCKRVHDVLGDEMQEYVDRLIQD